jgi:hypothetical protein
MENLTITVARHQITFYHNPVDNLYYTDERFLGYGSTLSALQLLDEGEETIQ